MTIGQRVAQKRKELGLSQEALGDRLGVSRQSIYKWESDAALPEIEKLVALSGLFGVSVGWLLGVEEDAAPDAAEDDGELTETQLKMIEEIVDRYTAALPKPKKSAWDKWSVRFLFAVCGLMVGCLVSISGNVKQLGGQYSNLQSNIVQVQRSVNQQIGNITDRVEEILKSQNDLTADYGVEIKRVLLESDGILFSASAVPKTYVEGMTVDFSVDNGDGGIAVVPGEIGLERRFSAELACKLTDSIQISAVFTYPDGTTQTQLLETYEWLRTESLPSGWVDDELMWKDLEEPGVLTLAEHERYLQAESDAMADSFSQIESAAISEIRMGLFKNQKLVAWAEPCDQPDNIYSDSPDTRFFRLPEVRVPLSDGDAVQAAAVVTDEGGRVTVWAGTPYILDEEGDGLTTPNSYMLDSDPGNWEF